MVLSGCLSTTCRWKEEPFLQVVLILMTLWLFALRAWVSWLVTAPSRSCLCPACTAHRHACSSAMNADSQKVSSLRLPHTFMYTRKCTNDILTSAQLRRPFSHHAHSEMKMNTAPFMFSDKKVISCENFKWDSKKRSLTWQNKLHLKWEKGHGLPHSISAASFTPIKEKQTKRL